MLVATNNPPASWLRWPLRIGLALALGLAASETVAGPSSHMGPHAQTLSERSGNHSQRSAAKVTQISVTPAGVPVEEALCSAARYSKNLLITRFPRRQISSVNAGHLYQAEDQLPRLISAQLNAHPAIANVQLLPASLSNTYPKGTPQHAQHVRELARTHNVQLILSGEITDMSMARPGDAYTPSLASRARNGLASATYLRRLDTRQREFAFQITLHDGITGAAVQQWHYHSRGVWSPKRPHTVGFGSPGFWRTDYGKRIADTLALASTELADEVSCLPLVASLDLKSGPQQIIVHSGTEHQLKAGDTLRLYQVLTRSISGAYELHQTHLADSQIELEIQEVHALHSLGSLGKHGDSLDLRHGRYVALTSPPAAQDGLATVD